jgi:hypothetical protein
MVNLSRRMQMMAMEILTTMLDLTILMAGIHSMTTTTKRA